MTEPIRFDDGDAYDRYMGVWSQKVADVFLDWIGVPSGVRWLDVGCGSGAFMEQVVRNCTPSAVHGLDPSEAQLAFARARPTLQEARFHAGDAMAMPFADATFDAAVMPLVLFFVPEPARGVSEMVRIVGNGGVVAAYTWDMPGNGFPYEPLRDELRAMGFPVPDPPSRDASRREVMESLWRDAGLADVETREITVERVYPDFDSYWAIAKGGPSTGSRIGVMSREDAAELESRMRSRLTPDAEGRIVSSARANAVRGRRVRR
jgi:SAM-dependent methyltransferase